MLCSVPIPSRFGPYSPSTRLFLNPLHASPALVFGEAHVADTLRAEGLSETFDDWRRCR